MITTYLHNYGNYVPTKNLILSMLKIYSMVVTVTVGQDLQTHDGLNHVEKSQQNFLLAVSTEIVAVLCDQTYHGRS